MKLLIVDDSAAMREIVRGVVADLRCEVRDCDNGLAAVEQYRDWLPDWVVMDVCMPGLDGFASTRMIRAQFPDARVVMMSIHRDSELHEAAAAAGARCFLHKGQLFDLPIVFASEE